jgi:hypothetical protein
MGEHTDVPVTPQAHDRNFQTNILFTQILARDNNRTKQSNIGISSSQRTHANSIDNIHCVEQVQYLSTWFKANET